MEVLKQTKMKRVFLSIIVIFICASVFAQSNVNPFKHIPAPKKLYSIPTTISNTHITAYRFMLPFAGYSPVTKQISTGIGYGWQKLHWIDSTQRYYADISIFGAIFVNGNINPSPYNFTSIGLGVGILNNLITIVPAYNLPTSENKSGAFDLKLSFGVPLN